ncbi:hypothetical protein HDU87_007512 [Geranomyces variabilis]|uniref:RRM domain-containing protein n=1 Tax=Geranomyces variabilis TaxID=109894 RepID=A0AAD5TQ86_9FUNG|nr:hypothetical protein HDU87_007512 [Geranomyces variabilis]
MAKKGSKKGVAMSLTDFLAADEFGSSWADDVADLPSARKSSTAAAVAQAYNPDSRGYATYDPSASGRPQGQVGDQPPWTCFVGNLAYDTTERDINTLFGALRVKSIRLPADPEGKPKGFGYVEFEDRASLVEAMKLSGESVMRRAIRIDVAEPPKRDGGRPGGDGFDRPDRSDELESGWRRAAPVAPRQNSFGGGADRGGDRGFGGGFRDRAHGDGGFGGGSRFGGDRDRGFGGGDRPERGFGGGDRPAYAGFDRRPESHAAPVDPAFQRKKMVLTPRTAPVESAAATPAPAAASATATDGEVPKEEKKVSKPNPFGAAKPRDENEIMKQIEERRAARETEKKAAEEAEKKKAEEEAARKKKELEEQRKAEAERREAERVAREEKAAEEKAKKEKEAATAAAAVAEKPKSAAAAVASAAPAGKPPRQNQQHHQHHDKQQQPSEESRAEASSWRRDGPVPKPAGRGGFTRGGRGGPRGGFAAGQGREQQPRRENSNHSSTGSVGHATSASAGPKKERAPKPMPTLEKEKVKLESKNAFDLLGDE